MPPPLKQIVVLRRRAGMTASQFRDDHYKQHGRISAGSTPEETPLASYQTHIFGSAYFNTGVAQPAWTGHDGMAELYFTDEASVRKIFGSEYVRDVVGTDGKNFNDFVATIPMFAFEEVIAGDEKAGAGEEQAVVASLWFQNRSSGGNIKEFAAKLNPLVGSAFGGFATKVVANVALSDEKGMLKFFKGEEALLFDACYQVLKDAGQIEVFLEAEKDLNRKAADLVVGETSFMVFGVRFVVLNQGREIEFDTERQPQLP